MSETTRALAALAEAGHSGEDAVFDGADAAAHEGGIALGGAKLARASLRKANLANADLSGADLSGAQASGVTLARARLEEAVLRGADLIGADLSHADAGEADLADTLLEDAKLTGAGLRFADLTGSVMDGADARDADLWGAKLGGVAAERANFAGARFDEADLSDADLTAATLTGASFRRANLSGARLRRATMRDAAFEGANLSRADLAGAILPHVVLTGCDLTHIYVAGAWMERTRMRANQLGGMIGEEAAGDYAAAREAYIVLEQNFRSLGSAEEESWAFRRRRRVGKALNRERTLAAIKRRDTRAAVAEGARWLGDIGAEWLCDYGESIARVMRAFGCVLLVFALVYWLTGTLEARVPGPTGLKLVNYLLFSLDSMTTVGTGEVAVKPNGQLGELLSSIQTVIGIVLLGLLGFVLGVRIRR